MGSQNDPGTNRSRGGRFRPARLHPLRWLIVIAGALALAWTGVVGWIGSSTFMYGDAVPHGCLTPARYGWAYEAVNYDIALDVPYSPVGPDERSMCPTPGRGTAGDEVVSSDGVRLAAWYIPAASGAGPTEPTVVVVHGWGISKSDALRYAAFIHPRWNTLVIDTRATGRASGDWMSFGAREVEDVRAMVDWLDRTKHPSRIALFGDSAGSAASITLARTDPRVAAVILDSPYARAQYAFEAKMEGSLLATPAALMSRVSMAEFWLRTGGTWLGSSDAIDGVTALGKRPLAISYGTDEHTAPPDQNAKALAAAAQAAGVPVEVHPCRFADHGQPANVCAAAYAVWLNAFLDRSIGGAS